METMWLLGNLEKVNKVDSLGSSSSNGMDPTMRIGLFDREKALRSDSGVGPVRDRTQPTHKFAPYDPCNVNRLSLRQMNGPSSMAGLNQETLGTAPWLHEKSGLNLGGAGMSHSHASLIPEAGGLGDLLTLATPSPPPPPPPPPSAAYNFSGDPSNVPYPALPATLMMNNSHNFLVFDMPRAAQHLENGEYVIYDERSKLLLVKGPETNGRMNNIRRCSSLKCRSTDSPMWRRGPLGPKTLCNACGIKYRKEEDQRQAREDDEANYIRNLCSSAHPDEPDMAYFTFI